MNFSRHALDRIPLLIELIDANGSIQWASREWERTLGWSLEEIQRHGIDIFPECYPNPRHRKLFLDFVAAAKGEWAAFEVRTRDGRILETMRTAVRLPNGTTIGVAADITERRLWYEALREKEQMFRQLADQVSEVFWGADPAVPRTLYVSPAFERVFGRPRESQYSDIRSFTAAIHPEDRQRVLDAFDAQRRGDYPLEITYRVLQPDGSLRSIWDRSYPVRDDAGHVYRFVGIAEDITDRTRAEEQLQRSETYLAELEKLSHIATWAVRVPSREIVFWSKEHYRIFGFDPDQGPPPIEEALNRIHPEDAAVLQTIDRMLGEPKDFEVNFRVLLPDGTVRYIDSLGRPLTNHAGEPVEFIGMAVDVTERKRAEDALQNSLEQLRALAAKIESVREEERTRLAREIHDELGQALTGIKIDVRSLIDHPPAWQDRVRRFQAILNTVDNAIQSVRRIATEAVHRILDDLGLVAAVEWAAQEFTARTRAHCTLDLPKEDVEIEPEIATALFRILQEGLTNVARHAEATEFSVRLAEEDGFLCLELRDNGRGFQQPQMDRDRSLGILGMKERAYLLGGRLTIETSPENGTTVKACMPRRRNIGGAS